MIKHLFPVLLLLTATTLSAQVSVNQDNSAPDPSAMLDVKSSDKGMLIPRMSTAQRNAIANPVPGLIIYNTQDSCFNYYTGTAWVKDCGRSLDADQVPFNNNKAGGSSQDEGNAICVDLEGNVYVTGIFQNTAVFGDTSLVSNGSTDVFVAKYGTTGQLLWALKAGRNSPDIGKGIRVDAAGNCYVTGQFRGTAAFGNTNLVSYGSSDVFVAKYDASGQLLWAVQGGGNGIDNSGGIGIDASGNICVTGDFQGAATFGDTSLVATGFPEVFVAKYTPSGQLLWALNAGGAAGGGTPVSIDVDATGYWYVAGYFFGAVTFGNTSLVSNGDSDVFVAKYGASGQFLWAVQGGGTNTEIGAGVSVDATGNCYVTGRFTDTATFGDTSLVSNGSADIFVVKYNPAGQVLWAQRAGGAQFDDAFGVSTDPAGNAYVTGHFNATAAFGGTSLVSNGNLDIFVAKYAPSGQLLWAKSAGGGGNDKGASICADASGNAHVTGAFVGTVTFDNTTLTSAGAQDMFVWSLNSSGEGLNNLTNLSASQDLDPDPANELQALSLSGTTLSISNGNSVDLAGIDTDTDNQTLGLSGATLSISNGNSVNLTGINTDNQTLGLSGATLSISNGNNVNLSGINTDNQTISLSGSNLSISNGNTIALPLGQANTLKDADNDTKILVEASPDEDVIHAYVKNVEGLRMNQNGFFAPGAYNVDGVPPVNGAGVRLMWVPALAALRVGEVTGTQWNSFNLGHYSSVLGGINNSIPYSGAYGTIAGGAGNTVSGTAGFIGAGQSNQASGETASIVGGNFNVASGNNSGIGAGQYNTASGQSSVVMGGSENFATGDYSTAAGNGNTAASYGEVALGLFATTYTPASTTAFNSSDRLFVIGNGSASNARSNALTILKSGNVGIGTATPAAKLQVSGGNIALSSGNIALGGGWLSNDGGNEGVFVTTTGRVGIGTSSPQAALYVTGSTVTANGDGNYFKYDFGNNTPTADIPSAAQVVGFFDGDLVAKAGVISMNVTSWSDARAKRILRRSDSRKDLDLLRRIQITDYQWIDQVEDHGRVHKKVIAQEVEQVLPDAVSRMRKPIPNVYTNAVKLDYNPAAKALTVYLNKAHDFAAGDKVRVFTDLGDLEEAEVLSVSSPDVFTIFCEKEPSRAFVYGKWVDDYRKVDYDAIAMLNVSATQELAKEMETLRQRVAELEAENTALKSGFEQRLARLEAALQSAGHADDDNSRLNKK